MRNPAQSNVDFPRIFGTPLCSHTQTHVRTITAANMCRCSWTNVPSCSPTSSQPPPSPMRDSSATRDADAKRPEARCTGEKSQHRLPLFRWRCRRRRRRWRPQPTCVRTNGAVGHVIIHEHAMGTESFRVERSCSESWRATKKGEVNKNTHTYTHKESINSNTHTHAHRWMENTDGVIEYVYTI